MILSKSRYQQFCRCPRLLWLDAYHPELAAKSGDLEARAETGVEINRQARRLFGSFADVTVEKGGRPNLAAMAEQTKRCMEQGVQTICEASFLHEGLYCAVDLLHKEKDGWSIYEVKSGTRAEAHHAIDIAFQKYVLERCGVTVTGTWLVCIDPGYVRGEELDVKGLFRVVDLAEAVAEHMPLIPDRVEGASAVLAGAEPEAALGLHCETPHDCPYWDRCAAHVPQPSVFDLYRITKTKKWDHYDRGLISYAELERGGELTEKQARQVRFGLYDCQTHIDRKGILEFLDQLSYPLYFLDFESMQPAIPEFPGTRPYAQIPFQYSLHYIEEWGGELKHREFLAESGEDPRRAIAESLCRDIPAGVCVTAYNKAYECKRLEELAERFPDLRAHLLGIRDSIVDLLEPFQKGYYYNRAMGGSFSIKSVLPALFPGDPELDYHRLEGVHNGSEAMAAFPRIRQMPAQEQEEARRNLLNYCKLDTYAMVKVWQKLCEAVGEG